MVIYWTTILFAFLPRFLSPIRQILSLMAIMWTSYFFRIFPSWWIYLLLIGIFFISFTNIFIKVFVYMSSILVLIFTHGFIIEAKTIFSYLSTDQAMLCVLATFTTAFNFEESFPYVSINTFFQAIFLLGGLFFRINGVPLETNIFFYILFCRAISIHSYFGSNNYFLLSIYTVFFSIIHFLIGFFFEVFFPGMTPEQALNFGTYLVGLILCNRYFFVLNQCFAIQFFKIYSNFILFGTITSVLIFFVSGLNVSESLGVIGSLSICYLFEYVLKIIPTIGFFIGAITSSIIYLIFRLIPGFNGI